MNTTGHVQAVCAEQLENEVKIKKCGFGHLCTGLYTLLTDTPDKHHTHKHHITHTLIQAHNQIYEH